MGPFATVSTMYYMWAIWGLLGILATNVRETSTESSSASLENPKLELRIDQPKSQYIEKYIHKLESNVILVNKTGIITLRLDCWAPYPIDLRFYGHLTNQETTVKTFRKEYGAIDNPESWFIINATMETFEQITGLYTCSSVENLEQSSSYYIYVSPTPPGVLLTRGQHINIQLNPEEENVIFPCAVSHPDVHVQLFKNDEMVTTTVGLLYDPKIGFKMAVTDKSSLFGSYSCRTELSPNDRVTFTLIPPKNFHVEPRINNIRIPPNGQLNISCDATEEFIIVSLPPSLPVMRNEVRPVDYRGRTSDPYYKYSGTFISSNLKPSLSGYISCKWKNSNDTFAEWSFSVMNEEVKKVGLLDPARLRTACPQTSDIILFECSNPVECRINSCLRKDSLCHSNGQICLKDKHCMQNGLIQCPSDTTSVLEIFFTGFPTTLQPNKTNRYVEWKHASPEELLLLEEVLSIFPHRKKFNMRQFTCQGSNFVFSSGFKWIVYFYDKKPLVITSLQDFLGDKMNVTVKNSWKEKRSNLESTLTLSLGDSMNTISFIECHAPVWNSFQWISRKIPVDNRSFGKENTLGNSAVSAHLSALIHIYFLSTVCIKFIWKLDSGIYNSATLELDLMGNVEATEVAVPLTNVFCLVRICVPLFNKI